MDTLELAVDTLVSVVALFSVFGSEETLVVDTGVISFCTKGSSVVDTSDSESVVALVGPSIVLVLSSGVAKNVECSYYVLFSHIHL